MGKDNMEVSIVHSIFEGKTDIIIKWKKPLDFYCMTTSITIL